MLAKTKIIEVNYLNHWEAIGEDVPFMRRVSHEAMDRYEVMRDMEEVCKPRD